MSISVLNPGSLTQTISSWAATDASTAGLTFSAVSVQYMQFGNIVWVYGTVTYPVTADTSQASINMPVAIPNQNYANALPSACVTTAALAGTPVAVANKNTSFIRFDNAATGAAFTNVNFSGAIVVFNVFYPAS